jgi:hypothetical protein
MASTEETDQQLDLLATYRRTLAHLLQQAAAYGGETYVPPGVANNIYEVREAIVRIKTVLRGWGVEVVEHPDDRDQTIDTGERASTPSPSAVEPSHHGARVVLAGEYLVVHHCDFDGRQYLVQPTTAVITSIIFTVADH